MKTFSIVSPVYEMKGKGVEALEYSFQQLSFQIFRDFDVVIGDHSVNNDIEKLCEKWSEHLDIKYFRNEENRGNPASNATFVMKKATGRYVKFLCQDDFLIDSFALQNIANELFDNPEWLFTAYVHSQDRHHFYKYYLPSLNPNIAYVNTLGTPSAMLVRNSENLLEFDNNLGYAYDCDFYYRMLQKYGEPKIVNKATMVNYIWPNSITSGIGQEFIDKETLYIIQKYGLFQS